MDNLDRGVRTIGCLKIQTAAAPFDIVPFKFCFCETKVKPREQWIMVKSPLNKVPVLRYVLEERFRFFVKVLSAYDIIFKNSGDFVLFNRILPQPNVR